MARRPGRARRAVERVDPVPDDDASAWARFLRRLTDADVQHATPDAEGVWARFLRRISTARDRTDDGDPGNER